MLDLPSWAWAPLIGVLYFAISRLTGEAFIFSRYSMYSDAVKRREGAVPVFFADGEETTIDGFTDFSGIDTGGLYPPRTACSLEWQIHEARRYFDRHHNDGEPGPVEVAWGFRHLRLDEGGNAEEEIRIAQRGRARRRH